MLEWELLNRTVQRCIHICFSFELFSSSQYCQYIYTCCTIMKYDDHVKWLNIIPFVIRKQYFNNFDVIFFSNANVSIINIPLQTLPWKDSSMMTSATPLHWSTQLRSSARINLTHLKQTQLCFFLKSDLTHYHLLRCFPI